MTGLIDDMQDVVAGVVGDRSLAAQVVYALIKQFGGERHYIPSQDYQTRNREIKALYGAGATAEQLAGNYRLSVRTVRRIIEH
jgi:Mor family transcriptional regulator